MEHDNKELVKQIDLLTMEKDQMYKVDLEMIQNDDRGQEINQLKKELQMKNIEIKVYANKLKMMREENAVVRMQLLDPSNVKRLGGARHSLVYEQQAQGG